MSEYLRFLHESTGILYYAQPKGLVGRIFVGSNHSTQLWYSKDDDSISTRQDGNEIVMMEDIDSQNTLLLPYFSHLKLGTIEDRRKAYAAFDDAYAVISEFHRTRKTSKSSVSNVESTIKRCKDEDDEMPTICDLQVKIKMLFDTLEPVSKWISQFLESHDDPIIAIIYDHSPVPAVQDLKLVKCVCQNALQLAVESHLGGNFNPLAKMLQFHACAPILEKFIPALRPAVGQSLSEISLTIAQISSTQDSNRIRAMVRTCLTKLKELDDRMWAGQTYIIAPMVEHFKQCHLSKEAELWWKNASDVQKQDKVEELWQSVKHDRKYRAIDKSAVRAQVGDLLQCLAIDRMMSFAAQQDQLKAYRKQLSTLKKDMDPEIKIKIKSET